MNQKSTASKFVSLQTIVLLATGWAVIALLIFLLFSSPPEGQSPPGWYSVATYVFEDVAFLGSALLCFRNWRSPQIVSGGSVWLAIGLGLLSFFIGNLFLGYWELGLGKEPDVSPGDLFYLLTYLFLGWGMLQAVFSRQLSLSGGQWAIVAGIALGSIALAYVLAAAPVQAASTPPDWLAQAPVSPSPSVLPEPVPIPALENTPAWAVAAEELLAPLDGIVQLLYIVGDIVLVVFATMLLLAYWGGRFSRSWRFIAAAALSFYIADMWFFYATSYVPNYQTGALPEIFWIFSGCLFAIGAALEYDLSTRRRTSRRRT